MSNFNPSPDYVCTMSLIKNPEKTESNRMSKNGKELPDFVLVTQYSDKLKKEVPKNFKVGDSWCSASGYIQEDGSLKITIKKNPTKDFSKPGSNQPRKAFSAADDFLRG